MLSPSDTAYPLLKPSPSERELDEVYTPTLFEMGFAEKRTRDPIPRVGLLVLLKTFQRLGYFVKLADVPNSIIRHVSATAGYPHVPEGLAHYDAGSLRFRHMTFVLSWTGVTSFDKTGRRCALKACVDASRVREDLADIINIATEELVRQRYELPSFPALFRYARVARATVNRGYYARIASSGVPVALEQKLTLRNKCCPSNNIGDGFGRKSPVFSDFPDFPLKQVAVPIPLFSEEIDGWLFRRSEKAAMLHCGEFRQFGPKQCFFLRVSCKQ